MLEQHLKVLFESQGFIQLKAAVYKFTKRGTYTCVNLYSIFQMTRITFGAPSHTFEHELQ